MTFKAGQSGNPAGRPPKGKAMTELLRALLEEKDKDGFTHKAKIISKLILLAKGGQLEAIKYLCDRLEGRPAQALELTGDEKRPLRIIYAKGSDGSPPSG